MKKIALVVQRFGEEIIGGSEDYALKIAILLSKSYKIDILTTTAKDHLTWNNSYQEGEKQFSKNIIIKRFKVDFQRNKSGHYESDYFGLLCHTLYDGNAASLYCSSEELKENLNNRARNLPLGFAEEFIKYQGPYSADLLKYIREYDHNYEIVIFMTYLYATTYYGINCIKDKKKIILIPTYHDELPAYLPAYYRYVNIKHLCSTQPEKEFAEKRLFKEKLNCSVIGYGMKDKNADINNELPITQDRYILYAGRLEESKGVDKLYKMYEQYYQHSNQDIKLFTIGDGKLKNDKHEGILYKGFVSEEEKLLLMKNAIALVHPSPYESLGLVVLEAFMMKTPAIVNSECEVLKSHIDISNAGFYYSNQKEFESSINHLASDKKEYLEKSENARTYFLDNFNEKSYELKLHKEINKICQRKNPDSNELRGRAFDGNATLE